MVMYHRGTITRETKAERSDIDLAGMLKAGPSLQAFYQNCLKCYGPLSDSDLDDEVFCNAACFELSLRMHANNHYLLNERETLINVISKLCKLKQLSEEEAQTLQQGRVFVNMIKHNTRQFPTWNEGLAAFQNAYAIIKERRMTII